LGFAPLVDYFLLRDLAPHLPSLSGRGKQLLAASPSQPLPADLVQRPKTGFTTPIARWLERLPASGRERLAPGAHWSRHWALQVMEKETRPQMHDGRLARGCLTLLCARRSEAGTVQAR